MKYTVLDVYTMYTLELQCTVKKYTVKTKVKVVPASLKTEVMVRIFGLATPPNTL
jgi:hypothetical protein